MLLAPIGHPEQGARSQGDDESGQEGPYLPIPEEKGDADGGQKGQAVEHQKDAEQSQNGAPMHDSWKWVGW